MVERHRKAWTRPAMRRLVAASCGAHLLLALCVHWSEALLRTLSVAQAGLALGLGIGWGLGGTRPPFLGAAGGVLVGAAVGAALSVALGDQPWWFLGIGPPGQAVTGGLAGWGASLLGRRV